MANKTEIFESPTAMWGFINFFMFQFFPIGQKLTQVVIDTEYKSAAYPRGRFFVLFLQVLTNNCIGDTLYFEVQFFDFIAVPHRAAAKLNLKDLDDPTFVPEGQGGSYVIRIEILLAGENSSGKRKVLSSPRSGRDCSNRHRRRFRA